MQGRSYLFIPKQDASYAVWCGPVHGPDYYKVGSCCSQAVCGVQMAGLTCHGSWSMHQPQGNCLTNSCAACCLYICFQMVTLEHPSYYTPAHHPAEPKNSPTSSLRVAYVGADHSSETLVLLLLLLLSIGQVLC